METHNIETIPASLDDIPGILEVQRVNLISLEQNRAEELERLGKRGFLIHALGEGELAGMVNDKNDNIIFVARDNADVCGYALAYNLEKWKKLNPEWRNTIEIFKNVVCEFNKNRILYLRHIARKPGFDRCGSKLMKVLASAAREKAYEAIVAEILQKPVANKASTEFHEYHGFSVIGSEKEGENMVWGLFLKKI